MKTIEPKEYALRILTQCFDSARETCDQCANDRAQTDFCGCGVNAGDLVDAVGEAIAELNASLEAAQEK